MNYPANGIEKNNGVQRTSGQFKHALWTWIVALVLAIYLFWQWQHGQGPASTSACCIAISPNASTAANNATANFHFTATAKDGYQATGDASSVAWATKSADLSAWLKGGEDWAVTGDAANIKLTGTVESQEIKQAKGTEAQVFFGTGVTVDNQLQVKTAETTASAVAVPTTVKLYFDTAKASLPADAKQSLAPIIEWLKTNTSAKAVISGYHDSHGSLASNQELAKNRAKAVSAALEDAGIDEDRIELRKPESTEGLGDPAEARRVEVSVE